MTRVLERPSAVSDHVDWLQQILAELEVVVAHHGVARPCLAQTGRAQYSGRIGLMARATVTIEWNPDQRNVDHGSCDHTRSNSQQISTSPDTSIHRPPILLTVKRQPVPAARRRIVRKP
jgi:hypothetical protein